MLRALPGTAPFVFDRAEVELRRAPAPDGAEGAAAGAALGAGAGTGVGAGAGRAQQKRDLPVYGHMRRFYNNT